MGRGLTVTPVWGMPLRVSPGLGLVVVGLAVAFGLAPQSRSLALYLAAVLASVLVHELAHGLAARASGYDVDAVVLTLFGARTVWSGPEPDARTMLLISAAGPAASAALACIAVIVGWRSVAGMNLTIALVNLVPIRGLDGWVIWRAATSSALEP